MQIYAERNTNSRCSRSSPCDHSCKRPALVTTTFAKPRLNCDLRRWQTRTHCCGNIVTHDVSLRAQTGKHLLRTQHVSEQNQKHFCVPDTKFVSATNVARAGKRGNICVGNNVSATMCPCLPVPLNFVMKSSRKRPRPLLGLPNWTFPLF